MLATMNNGEIESSSIAAARALESQVWRSLAKNDVKQAAAACEQLNGSFPDFGSGWFTCSHLATKLNNQAGALAAIEKALSFDPNNVAWRLQKAMCLARLGRMEDVAAETEAFSLADMKSAYQCSALSMLLTQLGQREKAVELYQKATELEPDESRHFYNVACLQRSLGELETAEQNFDTAIRLNASDYESYKIRSDLRKQTPERNHVAELEQLLDKGVEEDRGRVQICYALAKELEDLGDADRSFHFLKTGSDRRRELMKYDIARDLETIEAIKTTFSADVFKSAEGGSDNTEAIFILGMPRTGTTLVERILASHSNVFAAGELNNFAMQLTTMMHARNVDKKMSRDEMVALSASLDFEKLGAAYLQSTRPFTGHTARFIDKMPLNYLYVGLIHLALPNAKIINLHRDPMDTCYAVYKQLFVDAYPFSYDLEELANYYVAYHQLMEHWNAVLPGVVHTVNYEDVVKDLENESRQLLDYCNLEWQAQCLKFHENKEASTTASTAQIRRPVYQSSIGNWRKYESQLQPMVDVLQRAGIEATVRT